MIKFTIMWANSTTGKRLLAAMVATSLLSSLVTLLSASGSGKLDRGILVRFHETDSAADALSFITGADLTIIDYLPQIDVWLLTSQATASDDDLLAILRQQPTVAWAEKNGAVHIQEVIPNDNFYQAQQENLRLIGLPLAWMKTTGAGNVIAVIDTGLDLDHEDLESKVWVNAQEIPANNTDDDLNGYIDDTVGWDFVNGDNIPQDDQTHGSHVGGIAAAQTNNTIGIAGVSWEAQLMVLKALDNLGDGSWADVAEAVLYAADNGAKVINMSFGDEDSSETIKLAIEYALSQGCLLVAAAGNGGSSVLYPAAEPGVIAVAATNNLDLPWSSTNRGPEVDIAAPGVAIFSTNAAGSYTVLTGTSMSTPHVSGVASLLWSVRPELTSIEVTQIITTTAVDVWSPGYDQLTGWGRLSADRAMWQAAVDYTYLPSIYSGIAP
jgi:subtilisin family serine protease